MYLFKKTTLKDFPLYSPILLTHWFRYLQTRIKEKCMYLSSQVFFETAHTTLKFQQKSLPLLTKNISKHDRMEVFSTDIHGKNHVYP